MHLFPMRASRISPEADKLGVDCRPCSHALFASMPRRRNTVLVIAEPSRTIKSHDGSLSFVLRRKARGVQLERKEKVSEESVNGHVSLVTVFETVQQLNDFSDADDARYRYPLVFQQLRREADELFGLAP